MERWVSISTDVAAKNLLDPLAYLQIQDDKMILAIIKLLEDLINTTPQSSINYHAQCTYTMSQVTLTLIAVVC